MSKNRGKLIYDVELNISSVEKQGKQAAKVIRDVRSEFRELDKNEREAGASVESKAKKLEASSKALKSLNVEYESATKALEKFKKENGDVADYTDEQSQIITKLTLNLNKLGKEIEKVENKQKAFTTSHNKELDKQAKAQEKQIEAQIKRYDALKTKRTEALKDIGTGVDTVANYAVAGSGALLGGVAYATKAYLDYEAQEVNVMRLVKGDEENKQVIKNELRALDESMHEDSGEILAAAEVLIKQLDPDKYSTKFAEAMRETMDFALAADLDSGTAMDLSVAVATQLKKPIEDMNHVFSGLNAIQNEFGTDLGSSATMFTQLLPQALNAGYNQDNAIAMSGLMSIVSQKGESADARSLGELLDVFSRVRYATHGIEAFGSIVQGMGYIADAKGFEAFKADNPKKFNKALSQAGITLDQFDKELAIFEVKEDAMRATGITNTAELQKYADENPFELMLQMLEYFISQTGDGLINEYLADKSYLSGNSNTQLALANLMSNPEMLRQMSAMSTEANMSGDANTLEASELRETDGNKLKVAMKSVQKFVEDIGAELSPVIVSMVESLEPWKENLKDIVGRLQEMDPEEIRGWIEALIKIFLGGTATRFVTNFGRDVVDIYKMGKGFKDLGKTTWDIFKNKKALGDIKKFAESAKDATDSVKTIGTGKELAGTFAGLKGGFTGLNSGMAATVGGLSGLAVTLAAVTAVAAGSLYLEHQATEARKKQIDFERDTNNTVDEPTREEMYEDTESGLNARVKLQSRLAGGISADLDDSDLKDLENQLNDYVNRIDLTGDTMLQTLEETGASESTVEGVKTILDNTKNKQTEIKTYLDKLSEQETKATKEQLAELEQLYKDMDDLYVQMQTQTDEEYAHLKQSINTHNTGKNLDYKDREGLIESGNQNIKNLESARELELQSLSKQLADESITRAEYNEKSKQFNKEIDDSIAQVIAQQQGLAQSNSWFENIFKYNWFNDTKSDAKDYAKEYGIDTSKYGSTFNEAEKVVGGKISLVGLDADQVTIANEFVGSIQELTTTREGLDSVTQGLELLSFALAYAGDEGVSKLTNLNLIKDSLPTDYIVDLKDQVNQYTKSLNYAQLTSLEGLQMAVYSNTSEEMDNFMTLHGLWDNAEFMTKFVQIDTNSPEAEEHIYDLIATTSDIDHETIMTFRDNTSEPIVNIGELAQTIANLPRNTEVHIWETIHRQIVDGGITSSNRRTPYNKYSVTPMYANGTTYHPGGPAFVGDGGQHELVVEPGKRPWVSANTTQLVSNLARGAFVAPLPDLFKHIPAYADGTNTSFLDTLVGSGQNTTYQTNITLHGSNLTEADVEKAVLKGHRRLEREKGRLRDTGGVKRG